MSLCLSYWTRILHSKHSMILHPHTCNPHGLDGCLVLALPVHTFALGIFTPATVHQGIRREDTTYQNHSFIIQTSCLVCWTCMLRISECSIYSARIALFLKFIFKGAGLWILKKLSLNNLFLSLSTAYNCMCYSSNGNYDSFKYQARSTNTPLLVTQFS